MSLATNSKSLSSTTTANQFSRSEIEEESYLKSRGTNPGGGGGKRPGSGHHLATADTPLNPAVDTLVNEFGGIPATS